MKTPILKLKGICKQFPGVKALDQVDFEVFPGEVHILIGENGAGKSTLSKIMLGAYQPDAGEIYFQGEKVQISSPKKGLELGIAAVYQELTMVPWLNAAQNTFLNREPRIKNTPILNIAKMQKDTKKLLKQLDCSYINTNVPVIKLGVAEQQMIEIAKALSFNPKVMIFDEPTATLSEREVDSLFEEIHRLKSSGIGIVYISHRMSEFERIGDRITVMRDGKYIDTVQVGQISNQELVKLMVGRDISQVYKKTPNSFEECALSVKQVSDRAGKVKSCSLYINKGEIVGLAGLVGAGRTELARVIFGIDGVKEGKIELHGKEVTGLSPKELVKRGLGLLPEDRKGQGLALRAPIAWNIVGVSAKRIFSSGFITRHKNIKIAQNYVQQLNIATPDVMKRVGQLSGGNQQKVVIAKWLSAQTDVIIFDEPTRGIDIGAKIEIYSLMDKLASEGKAILMISSEMEEVMGMSDRMYIMRNGEIVKEMKREDYSADEIGLAMMGVKT